MKRVLMIGTGGTIASEMTGAGLVPELTTDQFLKYVPAVRELCDVTCRQVCNIDSTNMSPAYWLEIARAIREAYSSFDGFVVCHGTDTMAYTAAALSYLVQQGPKPIVLTGSQKPCKDTTGFLCQSTLGLDRDTCGFSYPDTLYQVKLRA